MSVVRCTLIPMTDWGDFAASAPELAAAVRQRLQANKHHVMATLRTDGWPRVSGTEVEVFHDLLLIGSMVGAVKVADLLRDGRLSIHTNPGDESMAGGDAKITGLAVLIQDESTRQQITEELKSPEPAVFFRIGIRQIVHTGIEINAENPNNSSMVIKMWTPTGGQTTWTRRATDTEAVRL